MKPSDILSALLHDAVVAKMNGCEALVECYGERNGQNARRNPCPSDTLSITYITQTRLGWNQRFRGEEPPTNCVIHGTASNNSTFLFQPKTIQTLIRCKMPTALC